MSQTIAANEIKLKDLKQSFGLQQVIEESFFPEWRATSESGSGGWSSVERTLLDRVKDNFLGLMDDPPILESTVKMVVLAPLMDMLGFYQKPFRIETETSTEIVATDDDLVIRGRIDILVLSDRLWVTVIESKRSDFSVTRAIPQTFSYMLANLSNPTFGLITNGTDFLFLKATRSTNSNSPNSNYANSRLFSLLNPGNELYDVAHILKQISLN